MNSKTRKIAAAVAAAALGVGAVAVADWKDGGRHQHLISHVSKELSLTEAQQQQFSTLVSGARAQAKDRRLATQEKVRNLLTQENLDKEDVLQLMDLRKQERENRRQFIAEQFAVFHATLDKTQRQKIAAIAPRLLSFWNDGGNKRERHKRGRYHKDDHHDDDNLYDKDNH